MTTGRKSQATPLCANAKAAVTKGGAGAISVRSGVDINVMVVPAGVITHMGVKQVYCDGVNRIGLEGVS